MGRVQGDIGARASRTNSYGTELLGLVRGMPSRELSFLETFRRAGIASSIQRPQQPMADLNIRRCKGKYLVRQFARSLRSRARSLAGELPVFADLSGQAYAKTGNLLS